MPFRSEKQRAFMYSQHPEIARRWSAKYGSKIHKSSRVKALKKKGR